MAGRKQVMDMRSTTSGVSSQESDEQQRNWTKQHWEKKAKDSLSNYDPTRAKLNFEVVKGGIIQPIDTSKTIAEKMAENLAARGIKDPNARPNAVMKRRTVAQFIFGGNRERMHELAFGNQAVDLTKGADNSSIVRCKDIEEWAKDVYSFMAKRFGEDNLISFYVHLDEKNPHCHCTLVPVDPVKNRISWKSVFGDGREAESANMTKLHSELQEAVSEKWGLERGSNMEETRARHRSTEEYKRELVSEVCNLQSTREDLFKQIHRAEIKLKGISTMIANLQARKDDIQTQIDQIAQQLGQSGTDNDELANKIALLRKEMEGIDEKLAVRYKMLDDANDTINEAKARLAEMRDEHREMLKSLGEDNDLKATAIQKNILWTYNKMLTNSIEPLIPSLSDRQQEILDESGYNDLTTNTDNVINCAMLLVLGYIREATTYARFLDYQKSETVSYTGNMLPLVPRHTLSLNGSYTITPRQGIMDRLVLSVGLNGMGKIYWNEDNLVSQRFYALLNAKASATFGPVTWELWGKNLTDTDYLTYYFKDSAAYGQKGRPVSFGTSLIFDI